MRKFNAKYKEILLYGICGVLTTLVNIVVYQILVHIGGMQYLIGNAWAWVAAFLFAYYTNSRYVFGYPAFRDRGSLGRFGKFLISRIFTAVLDMLMMWGLVDGMALPDSWAKVLVNVLVIVLNYVLSKGVVFRR